MNLVIGMADRDAATYLVLARADLLTERPTLLDQDVVTIGRLSDVRAVDPPNTIIVRWADLGVVDLMARTVDGSRRAQQVATGDALFESLLPGFPLAALTRQITADGPIQPATPLLYAIHAGQALHLYSRVEITADDVCFLRTATVPAPADGLDNLDWLRAAFQTHAGLAPTLNSYQCYFRKAFPGQELEHKYTLPDHAPIWTLAADTHHRVHAGHLPGFTLKYHDELQTWDYLNHLFDIDEPATERGYVSFIPSITTPGWRMKRKWFTTDSFARREQLTDLPPIDGSLDDYVHDVLRLQARRLPTFRRIRYDVNVESLSTGHYYGVFFDRCHLTEQPTQAMSQCEVEYCNSRTTRPPDEAEVLSEIERVAIWVGTILDDHNLPTTRSHYSKLSYLRDAVAGRAGARAPHAGV
ncbi:hypothetical protein KIF24_16765 [Micromonospora sp. Llam7]|uniref:hypothetical protein n=1 Tax=Micromonospora tarapacensis TaxID=2835305 RepID=UPI001C834762|nr:hypothetical protein [Micromonospora tarapacensis]MBX7267516.1 hypothetical protein [Micromonospora tarapacensis]